MQQELEVVTSSRIVAILNQDW